MADQRNSSQFVSDSFLSNEHAVRHALDESHLVPYFQPLVTLRTGQLSGFEVFGKREHPSKHLIRPNEFIPIPEPDGWIKALTGQILEKAFAAAFAIPDHLTLAINISPLQLRDLRLPSEIRGMARRAEFSPSRLIVEITERALIDSIQSAATVVAELKAMGCRLAIDDFGTGYSNLHNLQSLPFDQLKVDRRFVSSMTERRESRKIVSAVVGLGNSLGMTTVAEGIDTQEQAEMMLWLGCELGQGYFYGRPMPPEDLSGSVSAPRQKLVTSKLSPWRMISATNLEVSPSQRLAQLQAVYDGAPVGLAFIDQNLRYVNLNKKLADMNGAFVEDHLGSPVSEMIPEIFPQVEPYIRRALSGEVISDVEAKLPSTGETRLTSYQPALDEAGEVVGVAISVTDITERKRTEVERKNQLRELSARRELRTRLEVSNESLNQANQKIGQLLVKLEQTRLQHLEDERELRKRAELDTLKNEYVAMVSHELRSPLTSVRGSVGILSAGLVGPVNDKSAKLFHIALTNLDRMIRLIDDVLNLERIASGTGSLQLQQCSLEDLAQLAIDTMIPIAQGLGVELVLNTTTQICDPALFFNGDTDKILQVLINLLSNAIKFSPTKAEVVLNIEVSGDQLRLRISDEGRGIPEDQLETVFERFRQVDQDDARKLGGTGLGLSICRAIIEQHDGSIWAERNAVKGTSFFVTLPRVPHGR